MTLGKGGSKNINVLLGCVFSLILSGCSSANDYGVELPYDAWRLGFLAPNYMEVWIETANVVDVKGRLFRRAMSGVAAVQTPPNLTGNPRGWPTRPGDGAGKHVWRADVPRQIYVRWQSLAEPQTYEAYIEIPESARHAMLEIRGKRPIKSPAGSNHRGDVSSSKVGRRYRPNLRISMQG